MRKGSCWPGWRRLAAVLSLLCVQGCATAIVMLPQEMVEYRHQEVIAVVLGLPSDVAASAAVGAVAGPPGALVGAIVGVGIAVYDAWCVSRLGSL